MLYIFILIIIVVIAYVIFSASSGIAQQGTASTTKDVNIKISVSTQSEDRIKTLLEEITGDFSINPVASKNSRFTAFKKANYSNKDERAKQELILVDLINRRLLFRKALWRPYDICVSDLGHVLVHDMQSDRSLGGDVIAFDLRGEKLWVKSFKANVDSIGMSSDGKFAFATTFYADYNPHNSKLFLFNGFSGSEVWVRDLNHIGRIRYRCEFEGNNLFAVIETIEEGIVRFKFNEDGKLPKEFKDFSLQLQIRQFGIASVVLPNIKELLALQPPNVEEAKKLLKQIELKDLAPEPKAEALRYLGEVKAEEGDLPGAIKSWEEALTLNPRVGVKRKCQAAKKRLGTS